MLSITKPSANRIDITLDGSLDTDAMRKGLDDFVLLSQDVNAGRMFYTIRNFTMPTLGAIGVEFGYLPKLFSLIGRFDKCAVCADAAWLRTAAEIEGALIPGLEIKAFEADESEAAEAWLMA